MYRICQQYIPTRRYNLKIEIDTWAASTTHQLLNRFQAYIGPGLALVALLFVCRYLTR